MAESITQISRELELVADCLKQNCHQLERIDAENARRLKVQNEKAQLQAAELVDAKLKITQLEGVVVKNSQLARQQRQDFEAAKLRIVELEEAIAKLVAEAQAKPTATIRPLPVIQRSSRSVSTARKSTGGFVYAAVKRPRSNTLPQQSNNESIEINISDSNSESE